MSKNSKEYNKKNYYKYWGNPTAIKARSLRVLARRKMEKKYGKAALKGKEVDHRNGTKAGNGDGNLRVISRKLNRQDGQKKGRLARLANKKRKS